MLRHTAQHVPKSTTRYAPWRRMVNAETPPKDIRLLDAPAAHRMRGQSPHEPHGHKPVRPNPQENVYVCVPRDGRYGRRSPTDRGATRPRWLLWHSRNTASGLRSGLVGQSFDSAFITAVEANAKYLAIPTILERKNRATERSGRPDRANLKLAIVNTADSATMDCVILAGKNGLATFGEIIRRISCQSPSRNTTTACVLRT